MKLFCFIFAVLCYLAGREAIIIPPFMYKSIQFPKVSQRTFKTKGLNSIEGTFFWDTLYITSFAKIIYELFILYTVRPKKGYPLKSSATAACSNLNAFNSLMSPRMRKAAKIVPCNISFRGTNSINLQCMRKNSLL